MTTYVALLRGVNVGQNILPMAELRGVLEARGYIHVVTYIQSGNLVFDHRKKGGLSLEKDVREAIRQHFGLDVPVLIRTKEEWSTLATRHTFMGQPDVDPRYLHITFLGKAPAASAVAGVKTVRFPPDACVIAGREIFLYCPGRYGKTKFSNMFFERRLGVPATTRNLRMVLALAQLAEERHR